MFPDPWDDDDYELNMKGAVLLFFCILISTMTVLVAVLQ